MTSCAFKVHRECVPAWGKPVLISILAFSLVFQRRPHNTFWPITNSENLVLCVERFMAHEVKCMGNAVHVCRMLISDYEIAIFHFPASSCGYPGTLEEPLQPSCPTYIFPKVCLTLCRIIACGTSHLPYYKTTRRNFLCYTHIRPCSQCYLALHFPL